MAFFGRHTSAPSLLNAGDNTYIIVGLPSPSEDDDEEEEDETMMEEGDDGEEDGEGEGTKEPPPLPPRDPLIPTPDIIHPDADRGSNSGGESGQLSTPSHNRTPVVSESDASPLVEHRKKKRRAPLPPDSSPVLPFRHTYNFDSSSNFGLRPQHSTDTDSVASENILCYQNSTDSDPASSSLHLESARGSNFPGELAGEDHRTAMRNRDREKFGANFVDNLHGTTTAQRPRFLEVGGISGAATLNRSSREKSTFKKLIQDAIRSPQIKRKKSKIIKHDKNLSDDQKSPRSGSESARSPRSVKGSTRSPNFRKSDSIDPMQDMSDWIIAVMDTEMELDHEFEVKRVPDYDRYLSGLLEDTDPNHGDYEDLVRAATRVHSMVKSREDELQEADHRSDMDSIQERFPHDDLQLRNRTVSMCSNTSNGNNNNNNNNNNDEKKDNEALDNSASSNANSGTTPSEEKEKVSTKSKGLSLRRRSAPSAVLFRTLAGHRSKSSGSLWSNAGMGKKEHDVISQFKVADSDSNRMFIMEGSVQLATGMQIQERYLFLFSDLLLVAKQKSSTAFKLKHRVHLCDMWIASCIEEVSEATRPPDRSFVLGWPTTNVVATFPRPDQKVEWLDKLREHITGEKLKDEKRSLVLKVAPRDIGSPSRSTCEMSITNETQAKDVLLECLRQLNIPENDAQDYQLWVLSGKEGSPYPLIGHETPFSIKLSQVRELTRSRSRDDLGKMTSGDIESVVADDSSSSSPNHKCEFYLKQKKSIKKHSIDNAAYQKSTKRSKRSPNFINTLLRKFKPAQPLVFSMPLADICDENFAPPEPIIRLMVLVYNKGPNISGIMRKGNNAQLGKEIRAKIETGVRYSIEDHQAPTAASVFKEFLRCIPGSLLMDEFHSQWATFKKEDPEDINIEKIKGITSQMPPPHYQLLKLTICLLQHLAKHREKTNMGATNLATCIAPSFCKPDLTATKHGTSLEKVQSSLFEITTVFTPLIIFMITKHKEIFGDDILNMFVTFGCEASPELSLDEDKVDMGPIGSQNLVEEEEEEEEEMIGEEDDDMEEEEEDECYTNHRQRMHQKHLRLQQNTMRQQHLQRDSNSGTDSDSMHSVLSMPDTGSMGFRRDDSSIDSLVDREYFPNETESSPKATKSHLSPSNLSRDSGLTLSDTQLYDDDNCQSEGTTACNISGSTRPYQRCMSNFDNQEVDCSDPAFYGQSLDARYLRRVIPVAPPRKRSTKRSSRDGPEHGDHPHKPPFKHSMSTTQLDLPDKNRKGGDLRPMLTHPPFGKRISSDSIGEEDEEASSSQGSTDFQRMLRSQDMGTLVKTDSGTHLFLGDEMLPTKFNISSKTRFVRQSSVTDSTPPVSPQSRYSQSSDSQYLSRDSSVQSAPQTPDEPPTQPLKWTMGTEEPIKSTWDGRLSQSMDIRGTIPLSKSTSNLLDTGSDDDEDDDSYESSQQQSGPFYTNKHFTAYKPTSPKLWSGKSHEAEEVEMDRRPHFSLMLHTAQPANPPYKRQGLAQQLVKGSPPPNVILQSLQQQPQTRRESAPMKASYNSAIIAQVRRSSADTVEHKPFDVSKSMSSIRPEEYFSVTPKPIVITSSASEDNAASAATRAKLSKYVSSSVDLSLGSKDKDRLLSDSRRPDRPPNYDQALQRNFMIRHSIPVDITMDDTEKQKEISARAKVLYEESLQLYNEQRKSNRGDGQTQGAKSMFSLPNDNCLRSGGSDSVINEEVSGYTPGYAQSGFLDMGSISSSLQSDVLSKRNTLSVDDIVSNGSSSLTRNSSKLSDTGSSSGSSVTVSNLSRHSDSFGGRSDISNTSVATVSSATSTDSVAEATSPYKSPAEHNSPYKSPITEASGAYTSPPQRASLDQRNMAYSRHFRPVEPDHSSGSDNSEPAEDEEGYVTLARKDPKQLYLESKRMFEEHPTVVAEPVKPEALVVPCENDCEAPAMAAPGRPRVVSTLNVPSVGINRSRSDSAEHLNKLGAYSPRSVITVQNTQHSSSDSNELSRAAKAPLIQSGRGNSLDTALPAVPKSARSIGERRLNTPADTFKVSSSELPSDHHHKFLKAKSYFYHPEDDNLASPGVSPRPHTKDNVSSPRPIPKDSLTSPRSAYTAPSSSSNLLSSSHTNVSKAASNVNRLSASYESNPTDSPRRLSSSNVPSSQHDTSCKDMPKSNPLSSAEPIVKPKRELPWSVKDLKSIYDKDANRQSTSSSAARRRSPPPYQDPPPFRRMQDNFRQSTSSTSSAGSDHGSSKLSTKKSSTAHYRMGPQSNGCHDWMGSWSSSEDGYSSSLERRSVRSSGSEMETVVDHTNITYV